MECNHEWIFINGMKICNKCFQECTDMLEIDYSLMNNSFQNDSTRLVSPSSTENSSVNFTDVNDLIHDVNLLKPKKFPNLTHNAKRVKRTLRAIKEIANEDILALSTLGVKLI